MLELLINTLENEYADYPLLKDNLILDISLKNEEDMIYPDNDKSIYLDENDLKNANIVSTSLERYYYNDALTNLFNRGKYEIDTARLQKNDTCKVTCTYIDAVGLHEINNHLGHAAGDNMLCKIADGIKKFFPNDNAYRIGGDEFVVLSLNNSKAETKEAISNLKTFLTEHQYEISVGTKSTSKDLSLIETINLAEEAMRIDKTQFYHANGAKRQLRTLNHKLEKILLEKQDANQFLNVIAAEYKGVYMVNPIADTCRYIYIPEYFKELLKKNDGVFSKAIQEYCYTLVSENDQEIFKKILDFNYIHEQLKHGNQIKFSYKKNDGSNIHLQITIYDQNSSNSNETLWIFMEGDQ